MVTWRRFSSLFCCLLCISGFFYRYLSKDSLDSMGVRPLFLKTFGQSANISQPTSPPPMNPELMKLLKHISWPEPPSILKNFTLSTKAENCAYRLRNPRDTYKVGETLEVVITARDHNGKEKEYGGDFFQAKLHSGKLKAGVTGHVEDYGNGSYLATFLLPWVGEAQVHIRLIHSSEAVDVLRRKRESEPEKVYFQGYYHFNGSSKMVECNLQLAGKDTCKYKEPYTGTFWYCVKSKNFPCNSLVYHSLGGDHKVTNSLEDALLHGSVTDKTIPGSVPLINIMADNNTLALTSTLPLCSRGQESPHPSGFYYNDDWTSLTCKSRRFPKPSDALDCLKGKNIYMFGDSTLRQWYEYLVSFIPSLKNIDMHVVQQSGPLLAVEADAGLILRWRFHGLPLRTYKSKISNLHHEVAELAGIGGGPNTVVMFNMWAHFTSFPVRVYLERLERVRQEISALLFRSPETTVIIKSANTGYKEIYNSDWLALQLDILFRATFKGMAVSFVDAWEMTSCHYLPDCIHPGPPIIRNEVDLMLSYICPK